MIVIETPRLILREVTWEDVDRLATILSDPVVMEFYPSIYTYEQTQEYMKRIMYRYQENGFGLWATIHKNSNQLIGRCGLITQHIDGKEEVEIGYLLAQEYWGCGLATEAAMAIRDYAFTELGLPRLISLIDPRNIASQKVALKNGMKYEKTSQMWSKKVCVYTIYRE